MRPECKEPWMVERGVCGYLWERTRWYAMPGYLRSNEGFLLDLYGLRLYLDEGREPNSKPHVGGPFAWAFQKRVGRAVSPHLDGRGNREWSESAASGWSRSSRQGRRKVLLTGLAFRDSDGKRQPLECMKICLSRCCRRSKRRDRI